MSVWLSEHAARVYRQQHLTPYPLPLASLSLSAPGDVALFYDDMAPAAGSLYFKVGLGSFLLAHLQYIRVFMVERCVQCVQRAVCAECKAFSGVLSLYSNSPSIPFFCFCCPRLWLESTRSQPPTSAAPPPTRSRDSYPLP
jgi:uncharacterized membrane protein YhhN